MTRDPERTPRQARKREDSLTRKREGNEEREGRVIQISRQPGPWERGRPRYRWRIRNALCARKIAGVRTQCVPRKLTVACQ
jgi:hypothetical protein